MCEATFAWKGNLARYLRITLQRNLFTVICVKHHLPINTAYLTILKHTLEKKPFRCHMCEARFAWEGRLTSHLSTHTGAKTVNCTWSYIFEVTFAPLQPNWTSWNLHSVTVNYYLHISSCIWSAVQLKEIFTVDTRYLPCSCMYTCIAHCVKQPFSTKP